jgi:hypothetical protein
MKTLKTILAEATAHLSEDCFQSGSAFKEAHKKIEAAGFVKSRKHSSPGMNYYEHENGHTIGLSDTTSGTPEIETPSGGTVDHKDLDDHLKKVSTIKEEMTDEEIDAHNDRFNDKVGGAHDKYIKKIYGKNVGVNWGAIHDEDGDHGEFTSKVYHPKKGKIYVTTHYNTKTHEVSHHSEE